MCFCSLQAHRAVLVLCNLVYLCTNYGLVDIIPCLLHVQWMHVSFLQVETLVVEVFPRKIIELNKALEVHVFCDTVQVPTSVYIPNVSKQVTHDVGLNEVLSFVLLRTRVISFYMYTLIILHILTYTETLP